MSLSKPLTQNSYRGDVQGLRALAVLSVITFHTNKEWLPGGFIGVDIFLVISGFLIASIILRQKEKNTFSLKHFFSSRVKRIVPAYLLLLTVLSLCMAVLLTPADFKFFQSSLESSLYFASNQYFANFGDYFAPNANELPLMHTWSLAVEMQFYLFLPFLLTIVPSKYLKITITVIIITLTTYSSYAISVWDDRQEMYFSLLARVPEFLIGSWVALSSFGKKFNNVVANLLAALGLILVIGSIIFIDESITFPGIMALPACIGTALVIASRKSHINDLFSRPILVWIGGLSYSLYLWHWPILVGIRYYMGSYELSVLHLSLFALLTLVFSCISFRYVESAFQKNAYRHQAFYRIGGLVIVTVSVFFSSNHINKTIMPPLADNLTRYAPANEICHGQIIGDCIRGDKSSNKQVLLLGDSHAAQLNLFFDAVGDANGLAIKAVTASSCVTIPGFDVERLPKWAREPCLDQIEVSKDLIEKSSKIILAGMWSYQAESQNFLEALNKFLSNASQRKQQVIILAQVPLIKSNPRRLHRFDFLNLPTNISLEEGWDKGNQKIKSISDNYSNTSFLDLSDTSFFKRAPFYDGELIYHDKSHLNELGSTKYGSIAAPYLSDLLRLKTAHDS